MATNFEARNESLSYIRGNEDLTLTEWPDYDSLTPEQINSYLNDLKPRHYAALAIVIDELLADVKKVNLAGAHSKYSDETDDPFEKLRSDALSVFSTSRYKIRDSANFKTASEYTRIIGRLDPRRFNDLGDQLQAGSDTATSFIVTTLAQFPNIVNNLSAESEIDQQELITIARRSVGLPWQIAMLCVNQLMAARTVLADEIPYSVWIPDSTTINPRHFEIAAHDGRISSVKFRGLGAMEVPVGYTPGFDVPPLETSVLLEDLSCQQARTIGCPVTLIANALNGLWNWYIDAVEQRNLWVNLEHNDRDTSLRV